MSHLTEIDDRLLSLEREATALRGERLRLSQEATRRGESALSRIKIRGQDAETLGGTAWCGHVTTMGAALAETYARDPGFYSGTFCATCSAHFDVGEHGEFVWEGTNERVGT